MDQLILLPEDSLANLTASPGNEEATMMTVRSGRKCSESYERQGPLGSLVKMCLESSAWRSTACLLIWSAKATPARRSLFQLAPWMPSIDETESGLWPTPSAGHHNDTEGLESWLARRERVKLTAKNGNGFGTPLGVAVRLWPTPDASMGTGGRTSATRPTGKRPSGAKQTITINDAVAWSGEEKASGSLNPTWVEWLMGVPTGHTDLQPSETPLCPKSQKS